LTKNLTEARNVRQRIDLCQTASGEFHKIEQRLKNEISEEREELDKVKERLGEQEENARHAAEVYIKQIRSAQNITGENYKGTSPPRQLIQEWINLQVNNIDAHEAGVRINTLETELKYVEDVDTKKQDQYKDAVENVKYTEDQLSNLIVSLEHQRKNIDEIKERWLHKLELLVGNISERFSAFFEHMGYAGEVRLNKGGTNEDDFTNYGLEVMVKFRDKYDLQRLDPFKQSGGERSVSTALYMMAMQHMTQVPFRCVDEINQGMDERNERKVFDLLIETSVRAETPSQYFLLTPKLLNDLHFVRGVQIHNVHNGIDMSHGKHVLMQQFRRVAAVRKRENSG